MATTEPDYSAVAELYDGGRFLSALRLGERSAPLREWRSLEGRILAGRLAAWVGSWRLSCAIHTRLYRDEPREPRALYYHLHAIGARGRLLERHALLRAERPFSDADDETRAHLFGLLARAEATFRDFDAAEEALRLGEEICPGDPWLELERAHVLEAEDRYAEALRAAERALEARPWYAPAVHTRAQGLVLLGRQDEASEFLQEVIQRNENGPAAAQLAALQRERGRYDDAWKSLDRFEELSPLLDKDTASWFCALRSDLAWVRGDREASERYARRVDSPFHRKVAERLADPNVGGRRVVLPVAFVRQHHKTCGPATLAALSAWLGVPVEHLRVADEIWYGGTTDLNERRWATANGFVAREFTVNADDARELIDRGFPFAVATVETSNAHLQAFIGYDDTRGTFLVRDPWVPSVGECLAEEFFEHYRSRGPRGMVIVPASRASELSDLELCDERIYDRYHAVQDALADHDRERAFREHRALLEADPEHLLAILGRQALCAYDQDVVGLLSCVERLLERFPDDGLYNIQKHACLRDLGRREERLAFLEDAWQRIGDPVFARFLADELGAEARESARAKRLLRSALRREPLDALTYSMLGTREWNERSFDRALELLRIAACLDETNEDFAQTYFAASVARGRRAEALALLRGRFRRFAAKSGFPGRTLFLALEQLQRLDDAFRVLGSALEERPGDGDLAIFAAEAYGRYGRFEEARRELARAEGTGKETARRRAAAGLALHVGELDDALAHLRAVLESEPLDVGVHAELLRVLTATRGQDAAREHVVEVERTFPFHAPLRRLFVESIGERDPAWAEAALRELLDRDPTDAWAQRELALRLEALGQLDEAIDVARRAVDLEPHAAAGRAILGHLSRSKGATADAVRELRGALELSVDYPPALYELVALALTGAERREHVAFAERELLRQHTSGDGVLAWWEIARNVLDGEEVLLALERLRERHPELWQPRSALVGQLAALDRAADARSTAAKATEEFPLVPELWFDTARVSAALGDAAGEERALERALAIRPGWSPGLRELAAARERRGELRAARDLLERAVARDPLDVGNLGALATVLSKLGDDAGALDRLQHAVQLEPGYRAAWAMLAEVASRLDRRGVVERLARGLVESRPNEARSYVVAARVLAGPEHLEERLAFLERAVELNPLGVDAWDIRATLLAEAGRFDEALDVCRSFPGGHAPPELAARAAWVLAAMGDRDAALAAMRDVVAGEPNHGWAWMQIADWSEAAGDFEASLAAAEQLARITPVDAVTQSYLAHAARLTGDGARAKQAFRRALEVAPDHAFASVNLFDMELQDGELDAARATLALLVKHCSGPFADQRGVELAAQTRDAEGASAHLRSLLCAPDAVRPAWDAALDALAKAGMDDVVDGLLSELLESPEANGEVGALWMEKLVAREKPASCERELAARRHRDGIARSAARAYLDELAERGARRRVRSFVSRERDWLRASTTTWGDIGSVLVRVDDRARAIEWLSDWREREDALPWMLANLAAALRGRRRPDEAHEVSRSALLRAEDHCTGMHRLWLASDALVADDLAEAAAHLAAVPQDELSPFYEFLRGAIGAAVSVADLDPHRASEAARSARARLDHCVRAYPRFGQRPPLLRTWRAALRVVGRADRSIRGRLWSAARRIVLGT